MKRSEITEQFEQVKPSFLTTIQPRIQLGIGFCSWVGLLPYFSSKNLHAAMNPSHNLALYPAIYLYQNIFMMKEKLALMEP